MVDRKRNYIQILLYAYSFIVILPIIIITLMALNIIPQINQWSFLWKVCFFILSSFSIIIVTYVAVNLNKIYLSLGKVCNNNPNKIEIENYSKTSLSIFRITNKLYRYIDIIELENQILYDTALTIHTSSTLKELLDTVAARLNTHLKSSFALVFLLEDKYLKLASNINIDKKYMYKTSFRRGEGIAGYSIQESKGILVNDVQKDKRYIKCVPGCKSQLTIPLSAYNDKLGVLVLGSYNTNHFTQKDLSLLKTISSEIAVAINNTKLTEILRKEKENIDTLYKTTQQIAANIELDKVINVGLESISDIAEATSCSIMLFEEKDNMLKIVASKGLSEGTADSISFTVGEGIAGRVFQEQRPILVEDASYEPQFKIIENQKEGFKSIYSTPIKTDDECIGVINIGTNKPLSIEKTNLVGNIVSQLSISIQNALLHKSVEGLAIKDSLTNIYNHRYFQQEIEKELERGKRYNRDLSLAIIDIDNFKKYNDNYGHVIGDHMIKTVTKILKQGIRESDILARYGGDELVIIFPETHGEMARVLMERLKKEISDHTFDNLKKENEDTLEKTDNGDIDLASLKKQFADWFNKKNLLFKNKFDQMPKEITISVGIGSIKDLGEDFTKEMLIKRADEALLRAKGKGKNQVCLWKDI